jgi:hypothetical protein
LRIEDYKGNSEREKIATREDKDFGHPKENKE